ncbi:DUF1917-domain-containing protein (Fragment) [Madurella fahalii]|uniref:DUF1917-domain-containing protein n=1 Tax=Madurella fahalii TaxID=1157608 RepID=A0ABQ0GHP9_9PEZI
MDSDSDFYGDEETVTDLQARVDNFDLSAWWLNHHTGPRAFPTPKELPTPPTPCYSNHPSPPGARHPSESIEAFLSRLPPATTEWCPGLDWIWISNPFSQSPGASPPLLHHFREGGQERLALLSRFTTMANRSGMPQFVIKQDVAKERMEAVEDLLQLASGCNLISGKWMLFPEPENVNSVWAKVVRATADNELGTAAKVETKAEAGKERLICVYTRDFRDKDDVARVLKRMRELELVRPGGRQIYYKSDAWTELGIYGGNPWGIGASMYSSNEIFSYIKNVGSQRA